MYILRHASIMEIFQFLVAALGWGFAMWSLWTAFTISVELSESPLEDPRRWVSLDQMQTHFTVMSVQGIFMIIGVISILLPPPTHGEDLDAELAQAALVRMGLVVATVILASHAIILRKREISFAGKIHAKKGRQQVVTTIGGKEVARGELPTVQAVSIDDPI